MRRRFRGFEIGPRATALPAGKQKRHSLLDCTACDRISTSRAEGAKTRTTSLRLPLVGGGTAGLAIYVGVDVDVRGHVSAVIGDIGDVHDRYFHVVHMHERCELAGI